MAMMVDMLSSIPVTINSEDSTLSLPRRLRSLNNNNKLPKYFRVSNRGTVCPSKVFTLSKLATDSVGPLCEFFLNDHVKVGLVEIVQNSDWHHF